jgi:hypothetical protein
MVDERIIFKESDKFPEAILMILCKERGNNGGLVYNGKTMAI